MVRFLRWSGCVCCVCCVCCGCVVPSLHSSAGADPESSAPVLQSGHTAGAVSAGVAASVGPPQHGSGCSCPALLQLCGTFRAVEDEPPVGACSSARWSSRSIEPCGRCRVGAVAVPGCWRARLTQWKAERAHPGGPSDAAPGSACSCCCCCCCCCCICCICCGPGNASCKTGTTRTLERCHSGGAAAVIGTA
jgi:hypothetical protein